MKPDALTWYAVEREELPGVASGLEAPRGRTSRSGVDAQSYAPARVGFAENLFGGKYHPPSVIVLRSANSAELLSWLRVFSRESFPLTQYSRVVLDKDWEIFEGGLSEGRVGRTDKWASVVLGEMLAQSEPEAELDSIPLSRASACFTNAIARTELLHDSYEVTRMCTLRLRAVADDPRIVRRPIPIDSLIPVWASVSALAVDATSTLEAVELALHSAEAANRATITVSGPQRMLSFYPNLFSDSVEERVVAFQHLASDTMLKPSKFPSFDSALLAAGAFLVGRSTSHAFLIRKFPALAPMAYIWFGLIAALRGPSGWDSAWARATKGVERQLRLGFSWKDPPLADICWREYEWLVSVVSGHQAFADISRQFPRTMSIEIVPGSICQFRTSAEPKINEEPRRNTSSVHEKELRSNVEALNSLAAKTRQLVDLIYSKDGPIKQSELGLGTPLPVAARPKTKRPYKRSTDK